MGVDSDEMIRKTEQEERALSHYSFKYPAFRGELPFDLTFTFFGKSVTRKAKVVYARVALLRLVQAGGVHGMGQL